MKIMSRSGLICPIVIDVDLMLTYSVVFRWKLGDAFARFRVEPNHRWWYLLSCNFLENLINKIIILSTYLRSPLLFVRGEARVESNRKCVEHWSEALLLFIRGATRVKSMTVRDINQEPLTDLYALVHWSCVRSKVSLLRRSGTLIASWAKLRRSSWCAKTLIALHGSRNHALKAGRSLFDPIMKLKMDCMESKIFTSKLNMTRWSI
jgi:hypothetical protein